MWSPPPRSWLILVLVLPPIIGCREQKAPRDRSKPEAIGAPTKLSQAEQPSVEKPKKLAKRTGVSIGFDVSAPPPPVAPGPLSVRPPIEEHDVENGNPTLAIHPWVIGWNADSSAFGTCAAVGSTEISRCYFVAISGKRWQEEIEEWYGSVTDPRRRTSDEARRRMKARLSHRGAEWTFGSAISLGWHATDASVDGARATFELSARVEGEPSTVIDRRVLKPDDPYIWIEPHGLAISRDGKFIGITLHTSWGEWTDEQHGFVWSAAEIAARAYNNSGMIHHEAGRYRKAAALLHRAVHADRSSHKAAYNLACALSRLDDPGARGALALALAGGGQAVAVKARTDPDLAAVRTKAWFDKLLAEHP